jgi:hypothetical protein
MVQAMITPPTYLSHPNQKKVREFLRRLFEEPERDGVEHILQDLFLSFPLPTSDFPFIPGSYSRTILLKSENGYEAVAARWCKGVVSNVHGHPPFSYCFLVEGSLRIENFKKTAGKIVLSDEKVYKPGDFFYNRGENGRMDNNVHRVSAEEESLSLHIFSDDSRQGEVFEYTSK